MNSKIIFPNKRSSGRGSYLKQQRISQANNANTYTNNQQFNFKILRYHEFNTIEIKDNVYKETDVDFIEDVDKICVIRQNALTNFIQNKTKKKKISDKDCDEIDFKARLHSKANILNINSNKQFVDIPKDCQCECGCTRGKGPYLPLFSDQQQMAILGPGVILQFMFLKIICLSLFIVSLLYGIFGIISNVIGSSADFSACKDSSYCHFVKMVSGQNQNNTQLFSQIQSWLGLAFCIIWLLMVRVMKYFGKQKNKVIDDRLESAADKTVFITNLPYGQYQENELIDYLDTLWLQVKDNLSKGKIEQIPEKQFKKIESRQINKFGIKSVQIIYNMKFSRLMTQCIINLCLDIKKLIEKSDDGKFYIIQDLTTYKLFKSSLIQNYELLLDLRKRLFNDRQFRRAISSSCCLIQIHNQFDKNLLLKNFGKEKIGIIKTLQQKIKKVLKPDSKQLLFKGNVLLLHRAPQPSDVLWQNCQKTLSYFRIVIIYTITMFIIVISFAIFTGLDYFQSINKEAQGQAFIISIVMAVLLQVANKFIWFSLFYLLELEYNYTLTDKIISQMNKTLISTSVNIIVLPIISTYLIRNALYGSEGLAGNAMQYQLSAIAVVIVKGIDPANLFKKLLIWFRRSRYSLIRFLCSNISNIDIKKGVSEVNTYYQGVFFDIAENYVTVMAAIAHAIFFCTLQPILLFLVSLVIFIFYWAMKYKLLRLSKIPQITDYLIFETALSQANAIPIIYGVGTIVLTYFSAAQDSNRAFIWISPLLCILFSIFAISNPCDVLNKLVTLVIEFIKDPIINKIQSDDGSAIQLNVQSDQIKSEEQSNNQKNDKENVILHQTYYQQSNSLSLLGFQYTLRNLPLNTFGRQLEIFCKSFVSDSNDEINYNTIKTLFMNNKIIQQSKDQKQSPPLDIMAFFKK